MTEKLCEFLSGCPQLGGRVININYLGSENGCCSIEDSGAATVVRSYADGGRRLRREFVFAIRGICGKSKRDNLAAARLCEAVAAWVENENLSGRLPEIDGAAEVSASGGEIASRGGLDARYEMKITVEYVRM